MKNSFNFKEVRKEFTKTQFTFFIILFVLALVLGVFIPVILPNSSLQNIKLSKSYVAGELADEDVYAPYDVSFVDEVATLEARQAAESSVLPYFSYDMTRTLENITSSVSYMDAILKKGSLDPAKALEKSGIVDQFDVTGRFQALPIEQRNILTRIVQENVETILETGLFSSSDVVLVRESGYDNVTAELPSSSSYDISMRDVDLRNVLTEAELYEYLIKNGLSDYPKLGFDNIMLIADATMMFARPNVGYNEIKTRFLREQEAGNTDSVVIRVAKGDLIIERDTVITEQQLRIVDMINGMRVDSRWQLHFGQTVYLFVILALGMSLMFEFTPYKFRIPLYSILFLSLFNITILLSYFTMIWGSRLSQYIALDVLLPYLYLPVLFTCITIKRRIGFTAGFIVAGFFVLFPSSSKYTFFYLLAIIESSVLFVRFGTNRIDSIKQALMSSGVSIVVTVFYSIISDFTYVVMFNSVLASVANVIVTFIMVHVMLPIIELAFNIPTTFRLHELSYTDTPTLNRLNQVAQGTFNHVRNVSDMAYIAAKEIGANAELTRVGALYHDIGKAEHPEYFIENQHGKNAHDLINTNLSAAVIKSHVKLGVEKGREIGLPQEVLNIISEHHGNDIITFFFNEAKKDAQNRQNVIVNEEDFRYNGQIPQTPESAIVMLADCVEAASRTLKNPNTQKYDRLIMNIIISKINHNQLSDSKLTLTDLMVIKDTFIRILVGRDHQRIEYD